MAEERDQFEPVLEVHLIRWLFVAALLPLAASAQTFTPGTANDRQRVLRADSIAELRSLDVDLQNVADNAIVFLSGYSEAGDHSGVNYRYDIDCTDSDDASLVLEPTGDDGCWRMVLPQPPVDVRLFGVRPSNDDSFDNADALDRAIVPGVDLWFPGGESIPGATYTRAIYSTSRMFKPKAGFVGDGSAYSGITALAGFTDDYLYSVGGTLNSVSSVEGIYFDPRCLASAIGNDEKAIFGAHAAPNFYRDLFFDGSGDGQYTVDLGADEGSDSFTFSKWQNITMGNSPSCTNGLILRVAGQADMIFENVFVAYNQSTSAAPINIAGVNNTFDGVFFSLNSDMDAVANFNATLITLNSAARVSFRSLNVEILEENLPNLRHIIGNINGYSVKIEGFNFAKGSGTPTLGLQGAIRYTATSGQKSYLSISNASIQDGETLLSIDISGSYTDANAEIVLDGIEALDFDELITHYTEGAFIASADDCIVHLTGAYRSTALDHCVEVVSDTVVNITHTQPTVLLQDNVDMIAANADVARFVCPFDATVQRARSVLESALATGDALLTLSTGASAAAGGQITVAQSGSAAGDIDSATPTGPSNDNDCLAGEQVTVTVGGSSTAGAATVQLELAASPSF